MEKIKVAIVGYGNIGHYTLQALEAAPDFELVGIVRRHPEEKQPQELASYKVVKDIQELGQVDVAILATPSRKVEETAKPILALGINTVDSFDIHTEVLALRSKLSAAALAHNAVSIISAGWDPGTDSIVRTMLQAIAPKGVTYTNFGPGMSMGHTVAVKAIKGVKAALSMTIPLGTSIHRRMVYIELEEGADFKEVEAAQVANTLKDVDFGIINSNYAIEAKLNPVKDSLIKEDSAADYANILAVKEGNQNSDKIKALKAALESKEVANFIKKKYDGSIVSVVKNPTDGYDSSVNYAALKGTTITVAASPTPHAEILQEAKKILAKKGINLEIKEFTDYVQPNKVVDSGEVDANYFQHVPYLDDFNKKQGTKVVSVAAIHNEPMGLYAGKSDSLDKLKKLK